MIDISFDMFCALDPVVPGETMEMEIEGNDVLPDPVVAGGAPPAGAAS